jgi:hypothetical protein
MVSRPSSLHFDGLGVPRGVETIGSQSTGRRADHPHYRRQSPPPSPNDAHREAHVPAHNLGFRVIETGPSLPVASKYTVRCRFGPVVDGFHSASECDHDRTDATDRRAAAARNVTVFDLARRNQASLIVFDSFDSFDMPDAVPPVLRPSLGAA